LFVVCLERFRDIVLFVCNNAVAAHVPSDDRIPAWQLSDLWL